MEPRFFSGMTQQMYTSLWSKYRPAILQLMVAAEFGPQEYRFFEHEFKALNPNEKTGVSFTMQVHQGKALNNIRTFAAAQDLLAVLSMSRKAAELMQEGRYEFTLSRKFTLSVAKI